MRGERNDHPVSQLETRLPLSVSGAAGKERAHRGMIETREGDEVPSGERGQHRRAEWLRHVSSECNTQILN